MDSWEDETPAAVHNSHPASNHLPKAAPGAAGLNANAPSFSFNPGASTFKPGGQSFSPAQPRPQENFADTRTEPAAPADVHMADTPSATAQEEDVAMAEPTERGTDDLSTSIAEQLHISQSAAPSPADKPPDESKQPNGRPQAVPDDDEEEEDVSKREVELRRLYDELSQEDAREHMNIVFIGHVDAGKSTTGGQILYLTGGVDERTIQKYEREAKDKNRESWYMAYIMDTNEEERAKGKTVEVGRANFTTDKKRYTILDAPGHKNYVPNMIAGAAQADVGVLIIAARKGEFETGFERGGQTREHAQLAKTLGVSKLIVAVNKMDDPSITEENGSWSKARYDEIVGGLTPFLRTCGYNPKRDILFLPMSGLLGHNIRDKVPKNVCSWWTGSTLFELLDNADPLPRDPLAPFRMSVIDRYKDMGTIAMGKSEAGIVRKNDRLYVMPNKVSVTVSTIYRDDVEVNAAKGGENLKLRLTGIDEEEMQPGFVICARHLPVPCVTHFYAQLQVLDLLEHKPIISAGYKAVLHVHSLVEECEITDLRGQIVNPKTGEIKKARFVKSGSLVNVRIAVEKQICIELFEKVPQLGRFTLRDEGRTIAIGKITRVPKSLKENAPESK